MVLLIIYLMRRSYDYFLKTKDRLLHYTHYLSFWQRVYVMRLNLFIRTAIF